MTVELPAVLPNALANNTTADADEVMANFNALNDSIGILKNSKQGFLLNGKISVTVASNNLTVAIKTLAGTNPSTSNPVYIRIGDTLRSITAALSVTKNAGTNWCNMGSSELATVEQDLFVYLGYNATDGVVIGFSRYPGARQYSDFSATATNEKYCAISTISNAVSTDYYEVIGRFGATLSAGAGYTWSVPTFTAVNLLQYPFRKTRKLAWASAITAGSGTPTSVTRNINNYWLIDDLLFLNIDLTIVDIGTAGGLLQGTLPFAYAGGGEISSAARESVVGGKLFAFFIKSGTNTVFQVQDYLNVSPWVNSYRFGFSITYNI